jgi:hypothetical protein
MKIDEILFLVVVGLIILSIVAVTILILLWSLSTHNCIIPLIVIAVYSALLLLIKKYKKMELK